MSPWLALSFELEPNSAEAFGEALLEAGARSVAIDLEGGAPRLTALLDGNGDPEVIVARARAITGEQSAGYVAALVRERDWVRTSQAQFTPFCAGGLWIGPTWHTPPRSSRAVVRLDPGLAFGTGSHPSTQLALRFLGAHIAGGESVLDYGCGSGVLAIAAAKLGAASVDAVDVDRVAIEATAANARLNRVAVRAFAPASLPPGGYHVVVANILLQPLVLLAPLLAARTQVGGRLALAGILDSQSDELGRAVAPWIDLGPPVAADGWALVSGVKR